MSDPTAATGRPYPTKTRLALLRLVANGEVWQDAVGRSINRPWGTDGFDSTRVVTAAIAEQQHAGWVELVELDHGGMHWRPTAAGRAVLAEAAGELPLDLGAL